MKNTDLTFEWPEPSSNIHTHSSESAVSSIDEYDIAGFILMPGPSLYKWHM